MNHTTNKRYEANEKITIDLTRNNSSQVVDMLVIKTPTQDNMVIRNLTIETCEKINTAKYKFMEEFLAVFDGKPSEGFQGALYEISTEL